MADGPQRSAREQPAIDRPAATVASGGADEMRGIENRDNTTCAAKGKSMLDPRSRPYRSNHARRTDDGSHGSGPAQVLPSTFACVMAVSRTMVPEDVSGRGA